MQQDANSQFIYDKPPPSSDGGAAPPSSTAYSNPYLNPPPSTTPPTYGSVAPVEYGGAPPSNPYLSSSLPPSGPGPYPESGHGVYPPPPSSYGGAPPSTTAAPPPSYPGFAPPANGAPPSTVAAAVPPPNAGFAPPPNQPPPVLAPGQPAPVVNVVVQQIKFEPLAYGSSFVGFLRTHRHSNKFVSFTEKCQLQFTDRPIMNWNFILAPSKDGYFISCQWIPAPSPTLQLKVPPSPLFLRANRHDKWNIERFFGMPDADCLFSLENHGGHFAIRNRASNLFMSAEDHGLRADRAQYMDWEKFGLECIRVEPGMSIAAPFSSMIGPGEPLMMIDLTLSYHVAFRARISSQKNGPKLMGLHKGKIDFSGHDSVWEFIPSPHRNAFLIRNADHPDQYWHCSVKDNAVTPHGPKEVESDFKLEFRGHHFFFKSCATNKYATAESHRIVCNRDSPQGWEAFSLQLLNQI